MKTLLFIHPRAENEYSEMRKAISLPMNALRGQLNGGFHTPVLRAFKGAFVVNSIFPLPSILRAPGTAYGGFSSSLIGASPFLDNLLPILRREL